jgi:ABC transporter
MRSATWAWGGGGLQDGGVGLVGDEDLEAVADLVGEGQLVRRAGVRPLAAADCPGARRPASSGKVEVRKLGGPGAAAGPPVGVQGGLPCLLGQGQDGGLHSLVAVEPDPEPQAGADEVISEGVGRAGGVGSDKDRLVPQRLGQCQQGHRQHVQVILGGVGPCVAGPKDHRERLAGAIAAVHPAAQRMESEALLVGRRRALLVGVGRGRQPDRPRQWPGQALRRDRSRRRHRLRRPSRGTFGFLGPNGAGKSTTIKMLCTLATPTAGSASVAGHDVAHERDDVRARSAWCSRTRRWTAT